MVIQKKNNLTNKSLILLSIFLSILIFTIDSGSACTIFSASYDETVLFANNEDYYNYTLWARIIQPSENLQHYGGFYLGHSVSPHSQGGMNEKGLCFDANALPEMELTYNYSQKHYGGWVVEFIMKTCSNISEVIKVAKEYSWGMSMAYQVFFADAAGDAVVISPGTDGKVNFTQKTEENGFLVSTNFNKGLARSPCWRYDTAYSMLNDGLNSETDLSIDFFRSILDAVHVEGAYVNTIYSNIFDLPNRIIYLYYWHQFDDEVVKLNLTEELAKSDQDQYIELIDLFSQEVQDRAKAEYTSYLIEAGLMTPDLADRPTFAGLVEIGLIPVTLLVIIGYIIMIKKNVFSNL